MNAYFDICLNIIVFSLLTSVTVAIPGAIVWLAYLGYEFWKDR